MPSTTRGSILISTANDIGSTLVDKLGGDGYTPEEWDSAANLCGIASADIATALSNIQESTPGGADRGSISIAKANSIGRILNKKFDTSRGFKPSEWASAIDKLTPLEVKSASGAIASFSDGADGVPVKSCSVSFLPSGGGGTPSAPVAITGVSGLEVTQLGKNLLMLADADYTNTQNNVTIDYDAETQKFSLSGVNQGSSAYVLGNFQNSSLKNVVMKNATYTFSHNLPTGAYAQITYRKVNSSSVGTLCYIAGNGTQRSVTFTLPADYDYTVNAQVGIAATAGEVTSSDLYMQIEVGSTATTYSAYVTPSVVTDTFGQTIYGGTRDLTTDKASVTADLFALDDANITWDYRADNKVFRSSVLSISQILLCSCFGIETYSHVYNNAETYDNCIAISSGNRLFVSYQGAGGDVNAFKSAISGQKLVVGLATPTEITGLTPHEIDTLYGDNNIYADTGTTTVEYRADIDLALNA